ncbi:hypothetical protein NQ318_006788 [Aromia moschata]|uniref:Uncharacterized protein n=1 Tax=Aromia moschata TaxID=1265417 RepID=A0AAV8XTD3_9CUCU|nr:hypothetical protein NQ318_006788 [Aromia moschata]
MQQLKRRGVGSASEDDQGHSEKPIDGPPFISHARYVTTNNPSRKTPTGEEETVSFIDLQHNNLKLPEKKGILKKPDYGMMMGDGAQADDILSQAEASMAQLIGGAAAGGGTADVERTLKTLNGYHEDIIKALRNAASHRGTSTPSGSSGALSEELLRRSLAQCAESYSDYKRTGSKEDICEQQVVIEHEDEDEDDVPPCGPIRIRNLEDLIRQLEHHSRHMSPSGSEDIRMSETEADRHYRQESSSACSESSHQSHRDSRFVYGRYRQPTGRLPAYPHPHSHHQAEEDSIYESADHDRGAPCGDTPDSESDDFIQAQQQLARWASEDAVGQASTSGGGVGVVPREYFPSPSSSTSEEPPSIARAPVPAPGLLPAGHPHPDHATIHRPKRYPEYKH